MKLFGAAMICASVITLPAFPAEPAGTAYSLPSLEQYLRELLHDNPVEGTLYCESDSGGDAVTYKSCEKFSELRGRGCYGESMFDIHRENRVADTCSKVSLLAAAQNASRNHFELDSDDWWHGLPAELIPLPGRIYSDESLKIAKQERDELVSGKLLEDVVLSVAGSEPGRLDAVLSVKEESCGEITDALTIEAVALADFDGDEVAELLIEGTRVSESETCSLGSGNSLASRFFTVIAKTSPDGPASRTEIAPQELCSSWDRKIAPDMQIQESAFNLEAYNDALNRLASLGKHQSTELSSFAAENSIKIVRGWLLKKAALASQHASQNGDETREVQNFCEFLVHDAFYHD